MCSHVTTLGSPVRPLPHVDLIEPGGNDQHVFISSRCYLEEQSWIWEY